MKQLIIFTLTLVCLACAKKEQPFGIIPMPMSVEKKTGSFLLDNTATIVAESESSKSVADLFSSQLKKLSDISISVSEVKKEKNIVLKLSEELQEKGEEAYQLSVTKEGIEIKAAGNAGLFYGLQSLFQLCQVNNGAIQVPCVVINDQPRFKWRGLMLDESRHFFGKEFVKQLIDELAIIKINRFHWHLVDDQGWRIEIKKYPKLTEIGAWRKDDGSKVWNYSSEPAEEGKPKYGGFYTQEEIKEIVAYAAERFVTIVPEIEMPGHSTSAIFAYPELSCKGKPWKLGSESSFEFSDPLCAGNDKVFSMYEDIITEVAELFPSEYIHIGGDECKKDPWKTCAKCKTRMKNEKLANVEELQSYFVKRMEKVINSKGKKLIGWDEILEGGLAPEATVMSWRGVKGGIEAANEGHDVIMSPTDYCYFDFYQGSSFTEPKAIGGFLPLSKVYSYDPIPQQLPKDKHHFILGGQANVWTEHMFTSDQVEYMVFPRIFAMAEVLWSAKENLKYENFLSRLSSHLNRIKNINFRMPSPDGLGEQLLIKKDTTIALVNPMKDQGGELYYTTDGSEPDKTSKKYEKPLHITSTTSLKAKLFLGEKGSGTSQSWIFIYNPKVNGLNREFFKGAWSLLPDFNSLTAINKSTVNILSASAPDTTVDDYGLRFKGYYQVDETKEYTFYTSSDDGSRLLIDGNLVINNDGKHGANLVTGMMQLEKGLHEIEIQYFEERGGQYLEAGTMNAAGERLPFDPGKLFFNK